MASLRSQFVMTSRPLNTDTVAPSLSIQLGIVTQFAADLGTMTDLTTLGNRIIQELCRAGGTTHGALFLLDREHECYRRASMVGPIAPMLIPPTMAAGHPLPHHLLATNRIMPQADPAVALQETDSGAAARAAMESMQATRIVPHLNKGRLIAFSLLGPAIPTDRENALTRSMLAALAQTATNALDTIMLYEDLHHSHTLMKRTDRLKSLETIAGGFAHEIRNPLT